MLARLAAHGRGLSPEGQGALGMMTAMLLFALMDAVAKKLGQDLPALQVVWARYVSQTVLIVLILLPRLGRVARTSHLRIQLFRSLLLFGATSLFFTSLKFLELAEATALIQLAPLFITVLAALVLRELVGPRRWIAVAIGLVGALILVRPGLGVFQPAALLGLGAAMLLAGFQIATRALGAADPIWTTLLYTTVAGAVLSSLAMPFVWEVPTAGQALWMCVIGVPGFLGHIALVWALGRAEASAIAPFGYTDLVWAILLGLFLFGEVPDLLTLVGAGVIAGAGLYVWHRERVVRTEA